MTTPAFSLEQQLLTLALAGYAGAASPLQSAEPITASLASLAPLEGHWQLAWGPAFHRPSFAILDDSVMFVARYETSDRYAVVIRGTNPVSAPDWVLGDLWAAHDRPWATGAAGERVSLSSSLGLCVLQHMRAEPADGARGFTTAILKAFAGDLLAPLSGAALATITGLRVAAQGLAREVAPPAVADAAERAGAMLAARGRAECAAFRAAFDAAAAAAEERFTADLYASLEDGEASRDAGPGVDLASFFHGLIEQGDRPEIFVTGHSKGGALAIALARWLADTQGVAGRWDPDRGSTVACASYAGPTVGNAAFARGVEGALGDRVLRFANDRDLVTRGWDHRALREAATPAMPAVMARLIGVVADEVTPLDYRHVERGARVFSGRVPPGDVGFVPGLVAQHVDAYIDHLDLSAHLSHDELFGAKRLLGA